MTRRLPLRTFLLLSTVASLAGCGVGAASRAGGAAAPHGGILFPLPDNNGFAEVRKEPVPGKGGRATIVVYFLDRDRKTITPAPTDAIFKGMTPTDSNVPFKPIADADPAKAGGLVSRPISDRGEMDGDLTATLGGGPITVGVTAR